MGEQAVIVKEEEPEDLSLRTREVPAQQIICVLVFVFVVIL